MKLFGIRKLIIQKGFTLIELLVVVAILGVLAAAVLIAVDPAAKIRGAKDAAAKSDVGQVVNALQAYFSSPTGTGVYPADTAALVSSGEIKAWPASVTYVVKADKSAAAAYAIGGTASTYICWDSTLVSIKTSASAPTAAAPTCP